VGLEFIYRTLRTTGIVLLVISPFLLYYFGLWPTLAVFSGGVWGILNLWFIMHLVRVTIKPGGVDKSKMIGLMLYKFPVLYLSGYFLLKIEQFNPLLLLIGAGAVLAVMVLKAVGRLMLGLDLTTDHKQTGVQGVL
jgi:hypothetical protein